MKFKWAGDVFDDDTEETAVGFCGGHLENLRVKYQTTKNINTRELLESLEIKKEIVVLKCLLFFFFCLSNQPTMIYTCMNIYIYIYLGYEGALFLHGTVRFTGVLWSFVVSQSRHRAFQVVRRNTAAYF
jgi:hypothetical protein